MLLGGLRALVKRFVIADRANVAILFGLSSTALVVALGGSIDLAREYSARQKLSHVAELTCQYSARPSVVELANTTYGSSSGFPTYISAVNAYAAQALINQHWTGPTPTAPSGTFFTATASTSTTDNTTSSTAPTNPVTELTAQVPTYFMQIVTISQMTVHAKVKCLTASAAPQIVTSTGPASSTTNTLAEGFETSCTFVCYTMPGGTVQNGWNGNVINPSYGTTYTTSFTGNYGGQWDIIGYCVEIDITGSVNATSPEGTHTAELDCDNGNGSAGNSSITAKVYLPAGYYELRYNYRSRVDYPNYDPTYICGTTAADVAWANDKTSSSGTNDFRTNQINVYLDMAISSAIPVHTTLDGTQQLGGSNLIDVCVYSPAWIQRSIKITVQTPAYYYLSFAADGQNDSYGGQLDNIQLCPETCGGTLQDNFPASWLAANNGGVNKILFEDPFESPVYTQDPYVSTDHAKGGNLANSKGTTVSTGCNYGGSTSTYASPLGWPCQTSTGWSVAPYNEVVFWMQGAYQGSQYFSLQGWNPTTSSDISTYGYTNSGDPLNRAISRKFLLDPGYYNISYDYVSLVDFGYDFVYNNNYYPVCTSAPGASLYYNLYGMKHGYDYGSSTLFSQYLSTNFMNVYMSNGQLISTPSVNSSLGGAPSYNNPDGTVTSSPTVAPDGGSIFNTPNTSVNPVLDTCQYSQSYSWVPRSTNVKITKPGFYWLTFSAQGDPVTNTGFGPGVDDVKLTALGSLYMSGAPTTPLTTIPVAAPQNDTAYYGLNSAYNGFYIVADPAMPPAADQ